MGLAGGGGCTCNLKLGGFGCGFWTMQWAQAANAAVVLQGGGINMTAGMSNG